MTDGKATGYILWEGPSRIDGTDIVAIATMKTTNRKTGDMVQTWILCADTDPVTALKTRKDKAICGGCRHRGSPKTGKGRSCYVNVGQAPLAVHRAYKLGKYSRSWSSETFKGRRVRLGAYGDPAAIPVEIWAEVVKQSDGHTGYTHQWKSKRLRDTLTFCQASVDSVAEYDRARSLPVVSLRPDLREGEWVGGGSFRVMAKGGTLRDGEILCPASTLGNTTCAQCMMCDGTSNIAIEAHGTGAKYV